MEELHNFKKRNITQVLTSTLHIVTQKEPQTESYLAKDMNISFERALKNKQACKFIFLQNTKNQMVIQRKMGRHIVVEKFEESEYLFSNGLVKLFC